MRTGLDMGRGLIIRTGLDVGDNANASIVKGVSNSLLGVPDRFGLPPLPFSLLVMNFLGEELGELRGLERGVPAVKVSELNAELICGLGGGATSVSAEADVSPEKFMKGTTSLPSLSELSPVSKEDSPMS